MSKKRVTPTLLTTNIAPSTSATSTGTAGQQTEARLLREAPTISAALRRIERKELKNKNPSSSSKPKKKKNPPSSSKPKKKRKKERKSLRCCIECELSKRGYRNLSRKSKVELAEILASLHK